LSLAAALQKVFQDKQYGKIFLVKPTIEIGESLGNLPGGIDEKVEPYIRYMRNLIWKLHSQQKSKCSKIFMDGSTPSR